MRTTLALVLFAGCATDRAFLASDPTFQPRARELAVDVCLLHKPSAPYRVVGTLRVEANPEDGLIEVQRLALLEASRVGCELLIAPQLVSSMRPSSRVVLVHGGDDGHSPGPSGGPSIGSGAGPGPTGGSSNEPRAGGSNAGGSRDAASRRVVHEFACGLYRSAQDTDA